MLPLRRAAASNGSVAHPPPSHGMRRALSTAASKNYDVVIIGAGVIGSSCGEQNR